MLLIHFLYLYVFVTYWRKLICNLSMKECNEMLKSTMSATLLKNQAGQNQSRIRVVGLIIMYKQVVSVVQLSIFDILLCLNLKMLTFIFGSVFKIIVLSLILEELYVAQYQLGCYRNWL